MRGSRTLAAVVAGAALLAAGVTAAVAATPEPGAGTGAAAPQPGATYKGKIEETDGSKVLASQPFSFTVDQQARTVSNFTLSSGYPVYCAPRGIGDAQSVTATISNDKFRAVLPIYAPHHRRQGSLTVTGLFGLHNSEAGNVTTHFKAADRHACNGVAAYKTRTKSKA